MKYRRDIDGLRAFAVMPVIAFHAGFLGLQGGYLGVDIFFVISGYLITSILVADLSRNKFSVINFYEKRARRLLPALFLVLFVSSLAAILLLGPKDLKNYGQSVVSVVSFTSNLYFYLTSGYFSTAAEELPLLHTWSLAVEEQFYIFYPLLLMFLWEFKKNLWRIIFFSMVFSFLLCLFFTSEDFSASFYLPFSRVWELLAGGGLALFQSKCNFVNSRVRELLSVLGLALIIVSLFTINQSYLHPGWITLFPVLGTLLVIGFSENTFAGKLLALPCFVLVGLISYSLYLWHQPIFAFVRIKSAHEPSSEMMVSATLLTIFFSVLTYKFVEKPFRTKSFVTRMKVFFFSGAGLSFFFVFGIACHLFEGFQSRFENDSAILTMTHSPYRYQCHSSSDSVLTFDSACQLAGMNKPEWAVLGDSHGVELSFALSEIVGASKVHQLTFSACPPALRFESRVKGCSNFIESALQHILQSDSITKVILAFRHFSYVTPVEHKYKITPEEVAEFRPDNIFTNVELTASQTKNLYWHSFSSIVDKLSKGGKEVYILGPVPEPYTHVKKILNPGLVNQYSDVNEKIAVERSHFEIQSIEIESELRKVSEKYNAFLIMSKDALCDDKNCYATKEKKSMFFDDNHLSIFGSRVVIKLLENSEVSELY